MTALIEIILSREDANSDSALLVEWLVDDRSEVSARQLICVVETSKSTIEIESPADGTIGLLARAGEEVEIGSTIAVVAANADALAEVDRLRAHAPPPHGSAKATRKASELAAEHGIDLSRVTKAGFITVEDVQALVAEQATGSGTGAAGHDRFWGASINGVSLPAMFEIDPTAGALDPAFLERLRTSPDGVRALPAADRLALYRAHGAQVGTDVVLGERTLIVAPRIVLGDGVELGDDCTLTCDEVLCVGPGTLFRPRNRLTCRRVFIGAGSYFGEDVQIGGGGARDPQALLVVGDLVYVGAEAFINPCRPVVIGREVFVTMRSVIVTHNVGHSLLEGFENRFAPVVLEDRSQVGIGAVVYAGCRVGAESIVASNSYVVADIPPGKLAIGVPARVTGSAHRALSGTQRSELAARILAELGEQLTLRGHDVGPLAGGSVRGFTVGTNGGTAQILYLERLDDTFAAPEVDGETVVLTLDLVGRPPAGCAVVDLIGRRIHGQGGVVLDSVREFCRKRGIRFEPGPWRYRGGLV